ncbi:hypothetical protein HK105_202764 [Polyrhizophydium stewartii]|uniref:MIR domain-containing protein n=1 Tax=Polyrhizophydium stewartii TaxID=2732419 RepID=A0ABR4ND87_9FUNG|nr:Stromal cell-derived factor 2-like protein 1 [Polyrhizophydium stewartii]
MMTPVVLLAALIAGPADAAGSESFVIEREFEAVTCGSSVKLASKSTGFRLHSHEVNYGTGSLQQSVTGFPRGDDPNSYFVVSGGFGEGDCARGQPVRCGQTVRLQHLQTGKFLHSHGNIPSPLSGNQEVSAYAGPDSGDNWKVLCSASRARYWQREQSVKLQHADTGYFLGTSKRYQYQNVITGQLEVSARQAARGDEEQWAVQEGIFFASTEA